MSDLDRFMAKVDKSAQCWIWTAYVTPDGYGRFSVGPVANPLAHRWHYEQVHGPIPVGLELDHLCRTRNCVRLDHMELVTHRENTLRGDTIAARNAAKTHCAQGHEFDVENTRITAGRRVCRACKRAVCAARRVRLKTGAAAATAAPGETSTGVTTPCSTPELTRHQERT